MGGVSACDLPLSVPNSAVLDSGSRQVVLVDRGEGRFEPREVHLGTRGEDRVQVTDGIAPRGPGRDRRQLPDRRGKQPARCPARIHTGIEAMIGRLIMIDLCARNMLLVLLATLLVVGVGVWSVLNTPLDALPNLSDTQVIVYTEYPGQTPQVVEDQVTYPLTTALLAVPHANVVRGFSNFGLSFVYVVFEDGTDLYWARSRVLEYLSCKTAV
jgi:hypothetical protein